MELLDSGKQAGAPRALALARAPLRDLLDGVLVRQALHAIAAQLPQADWR